MTFFYTIFLTNCRSSKFLQNWSKNLIAQKLFSHSSHDCDILIQKLWYRGSFGIDVGRNLLAGVCWVLECWCCLLVDWIFTLKRDDKLDLPNETEQFLLTVSHFAIIRSFSNRANSRRSWMVVRSFQSSSIAIPMRTMAAITPSTMPRRKTFGGHSGFCCALTSRFTVPFENTVSL